MLTPRIDVSHSITMYNSHANLVGGLIAGCLIGLFAIGMIWVCLRHRRRLREKRQSIRRPRPYSVFYEPPNVAGRQSSITLPPPKPLDTHAENGDAVEAAQVDNTVTPSLEIPDTPSTGGRRADESTTGLLTSDSGGERSALTMRRKAAYRKRGSTRHYSLDDLDLPPSWLSPPVSPGWPDHQMPPPYRMIDPR